MESRRIHVAAENRMSQTLAIKSMGNNVANRNYGTTSMLVVVDSASNPVRYDTTSFETPNQSASNAVMGWDFKCSSRFSPLI